MRNSPEDQGDRRQDGPAEPPADLLRRALSHVEDLLGRLEYPAVRQDELAQFGDEPDGLGGPTAELAPVRAPAEVVGPHTGSRPIAQTVDVDPVQAPGAAADALLAQARFDAQRIRAEAEADAARLMQEATIEAERTLAYAEAQASRRLATADADDTVGHLARVGPRADANADVRAAAEADRAQAQDMLESARFVLSGVRAEVQALREALTFSLGSVESAARAIEALLEGAEARKGTPSGAPSR
jgi:cell division septum initiation protein DivIVA